MKKWQEVVNRRNGAEQNIVMVTSDTSISLREESIKKDGIPMA
jgi:hypothetical protein